MGTGDFNAGSNPVMASIPSGGGSINTSSRFIPQKPSSGPMGLLARMQTETFFLLFLYATFKIKCRVQLLKGGYIKKKNVSSVTLASGGIFTEPEF